MSQKIITLGTLRNQHPLAIPMARLTRHVFVTGMTGSGKTGLVVSLSEDVIEDRVPTILVDIKGDMCNMGLQPLEKRNKMNFRVLTPGGTHGEQINLFANLQKPERVKNTVSQLLKMIRHKDSNPLSSKAHSFLSKVLEHAHDNALHVSLARLIQFVLEPPFQSFGAMSLNEAFPERSRTSLATKLNNLLVAPSFDKWRSGTELDINELFKIPKDDETVPVTIYSVAHLGEEEQAFALALLFDSVCAWMRRQRGTDELRASLIIDECVGLLPPYPKNPPTKGPLLTMLKQARAYGLGLVLASQNPMDLDYKALSNCETWCVGRLQMSNDRRRVVEAITAVTSHDRAKLEARIGSLQPRQFVAVRPSATANFRSKDVTADLVGPMTPLEISTMVKTYNGDTQKLLRSFQDLKKTTSPAPPSDGSPGGLDIDDGT